MSTTEQRGQRLSRIGITDEHMQALESIWLQSKAWGFIIDQRTADLADHGYCSLDSLDAIWHELDAFDAHLYMQHDLTPHQAFLLDTDRRARTNLRGLGIESDRLQAVLGSRLPRDLIVRALLVAETPDETDNLISGCLMNQDDPAASVTARRSLRARPLTVDVDHCDCDF